MSFYEILGVSDSATAADIQLAYDKEVRKIAEPSFNSSLEAKFRSAEASLARETLIDPKLRGQYDAALGDIKRGIAVGEPSWSHYARLFAFFEVQLQRFLISHQTSREALEFILVKHGFTGSIARVLPEMAYARTRAARPTATVSPEIKVFRSQKLMTYGLIGSIGIVVLAALTLGKAHPADSAYEDHSGSTSAESSSPSADTLRAPEFENTLSSSDALPGQKFESLYSLQKNLLPGFDVVRNGGTMSFTEVLNRRYEANWVTRGPNPYKPGDVLAARHIQSLTFDEKRQLVVHLFDGYNTREANGSSCIDCLSFLAGYVTQQLSPNQFVAVTPLLPLKSHRGYSYSNLTSEAENLRKAHIQADRIAFSAQYGYPNETSGVSTRTFFAWKGDHLVDIGTVEVGYLHGNGEGCEGAITLECRTHVGEYVFKNEGKSYPTIEVRFHPYDETGTVLSKETTAVVRYVVVGGRYKKVAAKSEKRRLGKQGSVEGSETSVASSPAG